MTRERVTWWRSTSETAARCGNAIGRRTSWSSPTLLLLDGVPQIVVSSDGTVDGYDVASGNLLWTFAEVGGNTGATPLRFCENRFLIAASLGRQGEYAASAKRSNGAVRVTKADQAWAVERCWNTPEATPTWASPIVYQGCGRYWVNAVGVVYCFDANRG